MADNDALRRLLRSGPGTLARALGDPGVIAALSPAGPGEREPHFEIFDEGDEILVVADLPGVEPAQLRLYGYPAMIAVQIRRGGGRHSVPLPARVDPASLSYSFRNGVLAARARRAAE